MEDNNGNLVVIFAGYKEEMSGFVEANPGIASRLGYIFDFEDYNSDELCQIFDTSSEMSVLIQNEVNKILKECYNDSEKILSENKEQVLKLVDYLLEHKEIDEEQFLSQL